MRSFLGAYKVLSRVIPGSSSFPAQPEESISGMDSKDVVSWSVDLVRAFQRAQQALKPIIYPIQRTFWIVTDGTLRNPGIGATLYVSREDNKLLLSGFFCAKLRKCQVSWLSWNSSKAANLQFYVSHCKAFSYIKFIIV